MFFFFGLCIYVSPKTRQILQTSALCPGVSPVVLLTVSAGLASKTIAALTLTGKLHDRKEKCKYAHQLYLNILTISLLYVSKCPVSNVQVLFTSLHEEVTELLGSQPQGSQPFPLARFQWLGAQWSHVRPMTFGRHWHWPVTRWHTQSSRSIHWLRSVPRKLHVHSEGQTGKNVSLQYCFLE